MRATYTPHQAQNTTHSPHQTLCKLQARLERYQLRLMDFYLPQHTVLLLRLLSIPCLRPPTALRQALPNRSIPCLRQRTRRARSYLPRRMHLHRSMRGKTLSCRITHTPTFHRYRPRTRSTGDLRRSLFEKEVLECLVGFDLVPMFICSYTYTSTLLCRHPHRFLLPIYPPFHSISISSGFS